MTTENRNKSCHKIYDLTILNIDSYFVADISRYLERRENNFTLISYAD
jgi:hypothetical protein